MTAKAKVNGKQTEYDEKKGKWVVPKKKKQKKLTQIEKIEIIAKGLTILEERMDNVVAMLGTTNHNLKNLERKVK